MHEGRIRDVYDGWAQQFPWSLNQAKEGWDLHQSSQVHKGTNQEFGLEGAKTSKTPMATTTKLDKDEQGTSVDIKL